jgi:hypothetical protein
MKSRLEWVTRYFTKEILFILLVMVVLIVVFVLSPLPGGDDWETFQGAVRRFLSGSHLYGELVTHGYYSNPPWVAVLLIPLSLLPFRWGWAILAVLSFFVIVALCRRWQLDMFRTVLVMTSPATFYLVLHGEIDAFVLAGIFLPRETWFLVAASKPQVAIGLILGVGKEKIIRAMVCTLVVLLLSFLFFGFWLLDILKQPTPFVEAAHNLWAGFWPFQIPAGLAILFLGIRRKDERFLIAASPLLSPYAATSSFLGPWIALASFLKGWEALLIFLSWWGAVLSRL